MGYLCKCRVEELLEFSNLLDTAKVTSIPPGAADSCLLAQSAVVRTNIISHHADACCLGMSKTLSCC